jgi:signal recognition particle GTPase
MFESLSNKLQNAFRNLRGLGKISESNVTDALREVRLALLEADVNFKVARDFIERVKAKSIGAEVIQKRPTRPADRQNHRRRTHRIARLAECRTELRQAIRPAS